MRTFPPFVPALACLLALAAPVVVPAEARVPDPGPAPTPSADPTPGIGRPDGRVLGSGRPQTSDGVVGPAAGDLPPSMRSTRVAPRHRRFQVTTGVNVDQWSEGTRRGPVRFSLMTVKWRTRGLTVDYANAGAVGKVATVRRLVGRDGGIAGVNGDFYDIGDTGAPLGLGRDRERGVLNGRFEGWTSAFSISRRGRPDIGPLATVVRVRQHPELRIDGLNNPAVKPGSIAAYTRAWGSASGYRWTDGQQRNVRIVQVLDGRVVWTGDRLPVDRPFNGVLLIGRGAGAERLKVLRRGDRATLQTYVETQPRMAITGNQFLVRDGVIAVVDDREMHPRTAIGIDRDTATLLLLAVDGRSSVSRGYTMVELAEKMIDLGADEALNLDGGGSTTMVAKPSGAKRLGVVNTPSDGFERKVANAISIRYRQPR